MSKYIFNCGIAEILDMDIMDSLEEHGVPSEETLLALLDELLRWHGAMLSSLVRHQKRFEEQRLRDNAEAMQTYLKGKALATERDERKRYPWNMTNSEQDALREYDTGKAAKRLRWDYAKKAPQFYARDW